MIAKLLLDSDRKFSAREIARAVRTTEGNVNKEKSRLKATGVLTDERLSVLSHSVGDEKLTVAHAEASTLATRSDLGTLTDLPPLNPDDIRTMYSKFQEGETPTEVIAANGFNPVLVERYYEVFCRMNGLNPKSLVHDLVDVIRSGKSDVPGHLLQRIKQKGITGNNDITELVESAIDSSFVGGELSAIERITSGESIGTFQVLPCSLCGKPIKGALIEPESEIGRKILRSIDRNVLLHDDCLWGTRR